MELGAGLEYQTSKEGYEAALPLSVEYGVSKRLTFLFEPVPFTTIRPKTGRRVTGLGDLEMLLSIGISYDNNHAFLFLPGIVWASQDSKQLFGR